MARYARVVSGHSELGDPVLVTSFGDFEAKCKAVGGTVQVRSAPNGHFELTCSVLEEVGGSFEREGSDETDSR